MREEVIKATFLFVTNVLIHVRIMRQTIVVRMSALNRSIREIFISFEFVLIEIIFFSEAIMRSLRSNKEMVAALLTDYKSQDFDESAETLPVPLPLENKYDNRYENNEIRR